MKSKIGIVKMKRTFGLLLAAACFAGGEVEAQKNSKTKALYEALMNTTADATVSEVKTLIAQGADVNAWHENALRGTKNTPLQNAIWITLSKAEFTEGRYLEIAKVLIAAGADVKALTGTSQWTLLHDTAYHGNLEVAKLLIDNGADVNYQNKPGNKAGGPVGRGGWAPLHVAANTHQQAFGEQHKVVKLLIKKGAKVNAADGDGETPLHKAVRTFAYLEKKHDIKPKIIKALIEGGSNVNARDKNGRSPVHMAVEKLSVTAAEILRKNGGNFQLADKQGNTPASILFELEQKVRRELQEKGLQGLISE